MKGSIVDECIWKLFVRLLFEVDLSENFVVDKRHNRIFFNVVTDPIGLTMTKNAQARMQHWSWKLVDASVKSGPTAISANNVDIPVEYRPTPVAL